MQEIESSETENHSSKKRKMVEKIVVTVKIQENDKKQQKHEGPPSDCWSWRKYGQKPIKGSPYPRGYYRCSTSKGCSAKKQVERSKTDASMLIITYTSTHNHPDPHFSPNLKQDKQEISPVPDEHTVIHNQPKIPDQEQQVQVKPGENPAASAEDGFQYSQSPFNSATEHMIVNQEDSFFQENMETQSVLYNEDPKPSFSQEPVDLSSVLKQEENDFYDELEELPTSSFFTALMRSSFCEERVIANSS